MIEASEARASLPEMYIFDADAFDKAVGRREEVKIAWLEARLADGGSDHSADTALSTLNIDQIVAENQRRWSRMYSGKVYRHWGEVEGGSPYHYIIDDLRNLQVQLTDEMIEAAIDYPIWHVPVEAGQNRPLSAIQLNHLANKILQEQMPITFTEIAAAQRLMGVDQELVEIALDPRNAIRVRSEL